MEQTEVSQAAKIAGLNSANLVNLHELREVPQVFRNHIDRGINLIRQGQHAQAIKHFHESGPAQAAECYVSRGADWLINGKPPEIGEVPSIANILAYRSGFRYDKKTIKLASVKAMNIAENDPALQELYHEVALVHLEEWLHALQDRLGKSVAGYEDWEIDVAAYMIGVGIEPTGTFMRRYDRGKELFDDEGIDDSLMKCPALRREAFVRIRRTDGRTQDDWQVVRFHPKTGQAICVRESEEVERDLFPWELAELNEQGVYPFSECQDFIQLFSKITDLKRVWGTEDPFDAKELKSEINLIRQGERDIWTIPRSGGLREQVKRILIKEVDSFEQLYQTIDIVHELFGSRGEHFNVQYLKDVVSRVDREGLNAIRHATRTGGLRDKLKGLVEARMSP